MSDTDKSAGDRSAPEWPPPGGRECADGSRLYGDWSAQLADPMAFMDRLRQNPPSNGMDYDGRCALALSLARENGSKRAIVRAILMNLGGSLLCPAKRRPSEDLVEAEDLARELCDDELLAQVGLNLVYRALDGDTMSSRRSREIDDDELSALAQHGLDLMDAALPGAPLDTQLAYRRSVMKFVRFFGDRGFSKRNRLRAVFAHARVQERVAYRDEVRRQAEAAKRAERLEDELVVAQAAFAEADATRLESERRAYQAERSLVWASRRDEPPLRNWPPPEHIRLADLSPGEWLDIETPGVDDPREVVDRPPRHDDQPPKGDEPSSDGSRDAE